MKEKNENDALWDLLGKSPSKEASPYFVRKVLRAVEADQARPVFSFSLILKWLIPTSAVAAVVIGWSAFSWHQQQEQQIAKFNEYFDSIADLDTLVVSQDPSDWIATGN